MHRDFWNNEHPPEGINSFFQKNDSDASVILPLLLLLMNDGGDEMLIMALLYILS